MKFEIGTETLNSAVNKAYKGVGNIGLFLITSVLGIEGKDGNLKLTSTDNSRNVEVIVRDVLPKEAEFYTATNASLLKALVNKTDSALISLEIFDDRIVFNGDCSANLDVMPNDEGTGAARIAPIAVEGNTQQVKVSDLKKFLTYLKATVATSIENPAYTAYKVCHNKALTYNNFGTNLVEIGWDEDVLIPVPIVSTFDLLEDETANITVGGNKIRIETSTVVVTGSLREDCDEFEAERLLNIIYSEKMFSKTTVLDKKRLLDALDRLSLFIGNDDKKLGIFTIEVSKDAIMLLSSDRNFVEKVGFEKNEFDGNIQKSVGYSILKAAVASLQGDKVTANFGEGGGIRIVEDKSYMVIPYARKK